MEPITRLTGEGFHKKGNRPNHLNSSLTGSSFYINENKSETYTTLIQMLKSDLMQIQDMINNNSSDIKMYKLLSKTPGLTKKLSEIEESKSVTNVIEKISEDSKNIDKISKIYNCKDQELIQKLFLELSYNELLLKKIYDYFILMKLKIFKDDTYQESLSKIIPISNFMEHSAVLTPSSNDGLSEKLVQLTLDKEKLNKEIAELKNKISSSSSGNADSNLLNSKEKEIADLKNELADLHKKVENRQNDSVFKTEIHFKSPDELKNILEKFEKDIKKSREEFSTKLSEEITEIRKKFDKLETDYKVVNEERKNLKKNIDSLKGRCDPDSYEEALREQFDTMKNSFVKQIETLNDQLNEIKQESRVKIYRMEEEFKESDYLKNVFLKQVISLQSKLEKN